MQVGMLTQNPIRSITATQFPPRKESVHRHHVAGHFRGKSGNLSPYQQTLGSFASEGLGKMRSTTRIAFEYNVWLFDYLSREFEAELFLSGHPHRMPARPGSGSQRYRLEIQTIPAPSITITAMAP